MAFAFEHLALKKALPAPSTSAEWKAHSGLHEIMVDDPRDAGGLVFALHTCMNMAMTGHHDVRRSRRILWVQDAMARLEAGQPFAAGMKAMHLDHAECLLARAGNARTALWAMEEGLKSGAVTAVIGEIWGDPGILDFTASRRLDHAARAGDATCFLIRFNARRSASAARRRWQVKSLASSPHPHDPSAPGAARWSLDLIKSRSRAPACWIVEYETETDNLHLVAPLADGALPAPAPQLRPERFAA